MIDFLVGIIVGFAVPLTVMAAGGRYVAKHPEIIVKAMSRKMVREFRKTKTSDSVSSNGE